MRFAAALAALVACSKGPGPAAEPPRPPADADTGAPADAAPPLDAGEDLAEVRQVAFADVIKRSYPAVQRCWEKAAADDFRLSGTVTLAARFGAGGKLDRIDTAGDTAGDPVLTACLVSLFSAAGWPAVFEPGSAIRFPLQFDMPGGQYTVRSEDVKDGKLMNPANTGNPAFELELLEVPLVGQSITGRSLQALFGGDSFFLLPPGKRLKLTGPNQYVRITVPGKARRAATLPRAKAREYLIAGGRGAVRFGFIEKDLYIGTIELQAGVEVPEHDHPGSTEVLYILEGEGTMTVAGKKYPVVAGIAVQVPPGVKHAFSAADLVRAVQFYTPAGPEQRFKAPPPPAGR